jgi:hypothetical protein
MPDLRSQLRWYYQSLIRLRDPGDVIAGRAGGVTVTQERETSTARRWWRQPAVVAATAALLAFALFGGGALLGLHLGSEDDATVEPTVTTTTAPGTTTPSTTTGGTAAPTTTTTLAATTTTAPQVAGLVWARVPHDEAVFGGPSDTEMSAVVAGGPGLVAVGHAGWSYWGSDPPVLDPKAVVWTSTDGLTWQRIPDDEATFGGCWMNSVVAGGPGLVAVGFCSGPVPERATVWTSIDGLTWQRIPHDEATFGSDTRMASVVVGGPGLVAVGMADWSDARVWTSVDGLAWEQVPYDEAVFDGSVMTSVVAGGPGLVAIGDTGGETPHALAWTSVDGLAWERVPYDEAVFGGGTIKSVAAGGPGLVAVGTVDASADHPGPYQTHAAVWTSVDGLTWQRVPHDEAVFGRASGQGMNSVVAWGPSLIAVGAALQEGADAAVWTSSDGLTWERVPTEGADFGGDGGQAMNSVVAWGPGLVAVGGFGVGLHVDAAVWVSPPPG